MIKMYGIPNCDTVKKARAWLTQQGVAHEFHDFKKHGVPLDDLNHWQNAVGWEALLNRKGTTWRQLQAEEQAQVADAQTAAALMVAHPSVVKRPVVVWPTGVTVGFDADRWSALLP